MALYDHIKRPGPPPATFGPPPPIPVHIQPPSAVPQVQHALFNAFGGIIHQDLYPYSPSDSSLWLELFIIADQVDHEFTVRLEWLRAVGANLILDQQFGFRITPIIDPTGVNGWTSQEHYDTEKVCLEPHINQVVEALRELRRRYDTGRIR